MVKSTNDSQSTHMVFKKKSKKSISKKTNKKTKKLNKATVESVVEKVSEVKVQETPKEVPVVVHQEKPIEQPSSLTSTKKKKKRKNKKSKNAPNVKQQEEEEKKKELNKINKDHSEEEEEIKEKKVVKKNSKKGKKKDTKKVVKVQKKEESDSSSNDSDDAMEEEPKSEIKEQPQEEDVQMNQEGAFMWNTVQFKDQAASKKEEDDSSSDEENESEDEEEQGDSKMKGDDSKKKNESDDDEEEDENDEDEYADDYDNEDEITKKQIQNLKKKTKKLTEKVIRTRENELLDNTLPQTEHDFERMLMASPNSSYLWIQYMAFKLSLTDIDGARSIAKRALKKINFKEEQEKFNIYAAWMNLEVKYGTESTQNGVFVEARQMSNPKKVYLQMAKTHENNDDMDKAEDYLKKACKKFKSKKSVWEEYEMFALKRKDLKKANQILERSLLSLPKRKHLTAISKFATFHYKHGSIINGNKLFEGILQNYPNRTDVWSMFLDMEIAIKRVDTVKELFERIVHSKLSSKKMKKFLERYLEFVQQYGQEGDEEHVKNIARQYIEFKLGQ